MTSTLSAPRTPTPPFTAAPGTPVHDVTGRLVRALDAARHTGFAGVPELALAIDDFVAARRAQGLPRDAVLTALDALTRLYGAVARGRRRARRPRRVPRASLGRPGGLARPAAVRGRDRALHERERPVHQERERGRR
jgi:hypothetical protein